MAEADATLTNANVNSGTAVLLNARSVTYAWSNITKPTPADGKYDIVTSHFGGFENPKIVVQGIIDNRRAIANSMTHVLLVNFAACKAGTTALKVNYGTTPTILGGRPTAGYVSTGSNTLDTTNGIDVQIENFNINIDYSADASGQVWRYQLTMHETV